MNGTSIRERKRGDITDIHGKRATRENKSVMSRFPSPRFPSLSRFPSLLFAITTALLAQEVSVATGADELLQQRQRLANITPGTRAEQAIHSLGKPDEIRRIAIGGLLDGCRILYITPGGMELDEAERWVYRPLATGMFAATGFLSLSRDGIVIGAEPADYFCKPKAKIPHLVPAPSDMAVEASGKLLCRVLWVEPVEGRGETQRSLKVKAAITNAGQKRFEVKDPVASDFHWLMIVEVRDATGALLFREYRPEGSSFHPQGPPQTLSVPAGAERSDTFFVQPEIGFGRLPPGTYYLRVYFPLERSDYFPSNRIRFDLK
jgi:hypothetical protein